MTMEPGADAQAGAAPIGPGKDSSDAPPESDSGVCLDEDELTALLAGGLGGPDAERFHAHLDRCGDCVRILAAASRSARSAEAGESEREAPPPWVPVTDLALLPGTRLSRYVLLAVLGR